jgi:predicted ABC-type transport system involved in lysophospholipase L1 biosynthesis ATPase subunit
MTGSGKSTLLHAMAGLTEIDAGSVAIDGHHLAQFSHAELALFRGRNSRIVTLVDGSARAISNNIDLGAWRSLGTRNGGEIVSDF